MAKWSLFLFSILIATAPIFGQEKTFSLDFKNTSLESALEKLSNETRFLFSYNPDNFPKNIKVDKSYSNQSLADILADLLKEHKLEFSIMQNMVIITSKREIPQAPQVTEIRSLPSESAPPTKVRDSLIFVYDTITIEKIIYDTLHHTITEKYYDTTTVIKTLSQYELQTGNFSISVYGGLAYPFLQKTQPDQSEDTYSLSKAPSANVGLKLFFEKNKLEIGTGIEYTGLHFEYTHYVDSVQVFYETDTIGSYYTIVDNEPQYVYIIDSTEHHFNVTYSEKQSANCQRLSFPIRLTYRLDLGKKVSARIGGEGIISLLVNKNRERLLDINTNPYFDYAFLIQLGYKLSYNSLVFLEGRYRGRSGAFLNNSSYKTAFAEANIGLRIFFNQ